MRRRILGPTILFLLTILALIPPIINYNATTPVVYADDVVLPNGVHLNASETFIAYDEYLHSTGTGNSSMLFVLVELVNASDIGPCGAGDLSVHTFQVFFESNDTFVFEDNLEYNATKGWAVDNYSLLSQNISTGFDYYVTCYFERDITGVGLVNVTSDQSLGFHYAHRLAITAPTFTYIGDTSDTIDIDVEYISSTLRGDLTAVTNSTVIFRNTGNHSEVHQFENVLLYNLTSQHWEVNELNISILTADQAYQIRIGAVYNVTPPWHSGLGVWASPFTFRGPYLLIEQPDMQYFGRDTQVLNITVSSVWDSIYGFLSASNVTIANFSIYLANGGNNALVNGSFLWNNTGSYWYAANFNITDYITLGILDVGESYNITAFFETDVLGVRYPINGSSPFSLPFLLDRDPPNVTRTLLDPEIPTDEDMVVITSEVTDDAAIDTVILSYNNGTHWINFTMQGAGGKLANYTGVIPIFHETFEVQYRIYINDTQNAWFNTAVLSYTVAETPPLIAFVTILPTNPKDADSVTVNATITDGTGVQTVRLLYSFDGINFIPINMEDKGNSLYQAVIPRYFPLMTFQYQSVIFKIEAVDVYDNQRTSTTFAYLVQGTVPGFDPVLGLLMLSVIPLIVVALIIVYKVYEQF